VGPRRIPGAGSNRKLVVMAPPTPNMPADREKRWRKATEARLSWPAPCTRFKCPVIAQDGQGGLECKKDGKNLEGTAKSLGMNFYVKGVDDKVPGK